MPKHTLITDGLDDAALRDFHTLLDDRKVTIDAARSWLVERGLRVGRTAVGRYLFKYRSDPVRKLRDEMGLDGAADLRAMVWQITRRLVGNDLALLALYACYLERKGGRAKGGQK